MLSIGLPKMLRVYVQSKHMDNVYKLNYEDLVQDPANSLKALCNFLELDYEPKILDKWADRKVKEMGDYWGEQRYNDISVNPVTDWINFFNTPIRRYFAKRYLHFIGNAALNESGYTAEKLLGQIKNTRTGYKTFASDLLYSIYDATQYFMRKAGDKLLRSAGGILYSKKI
jgi:hypothetical protein